MFVSCNRGKRSDERNRLTVTPNDGLLRRQPVQHHSWEVGKTNGRKSPKFTSCVVSTSYDIRRFGKKQGSSCMRLQCKFQEPPMNVLVG